MINLRAQELISQRVPFVSARVVLAERPTSAKAGDQALVLADGTIEGFVGGACAEATVRAQALALLDSGETLLLRISPTALPAGSDDSAGRKTVHNPCLSGGTMEIFLEPVRPAPLLVIVGAAPIAHALKRLADAMGYDIRRGGDETCAISELLVGATAVVVASHGRDEEETLRAALELGTQYVGLVASPKRGEAVLASLGLCSSHTSRVRTPAGLAIGARTPDEIALSILAEIVSVRPRPVGRGVDPGGSDATDAVLTGTGPASSAAPGVVHGVVLSNAVDPVCSMSVAMVESSLHFDHDGRRFWFCGSGCLRAFAAAPTAYPS